MATSGSPEDESISVVDESSSGPEVGPYSGGLPEFHMYTGRGAEEEEASRYALNLSCQVLQKKNRELESQVVKLQRENNKYKKRSGSRNSDLGTSASGMDLDASLSPPNSVYRSRSAALGEPLTDNVDQVARAQVEYIQYLEKQLEKCEDEKNDLASKLDLEKATSRSTEQKRREASTELGQCLEIAASRLHEIDQLRAEISQSRIKGDEMNSQKNIIAVLSEKRRELEAKVFQLQGENASMQQLYEESANKHVHFEKMREDNARKEADMLEKISELEGAIVRLKEAHQTQIEVVRRDAAVKLSASRQGPQRNESDMDQDDNNSLLDETKRELTDLQRQVLDMHKVIQTQTGLIQELANKLRQKTIAGSLTGASTSPNSSPRPGSGARPRVPLTSRSVSQTSPEPMSTPVLCHEDLCSIGNDRSDEFTTLTEIPGPTAGRRSPAGGPGYGFAPRPAQANSPSWNSSVGRSTSPVLNKRVPVEQSNVISQRDLTALSPPAASGIIVNGEKPLASPRHRDTDVPSAQNPRPFDFSAQAVVSHNTEPLIRHPPSFNGAPWPTRNAVTEPLAATNPFRPHISVEPNLGGFRQPAYPVRPQVVNLPERPEGRTNLTPPGAYYPGRRVPTEQSDRVLPGPKLCPICAKDFPNLTQGSFEYHVNHCLDTSEKGPAPTDPAQGGPATTECLECPICNQVYPPGVSQADFQNHVDGHFPEDKFEMLGS